MLRGACRRALPLLRPWAAAGSSGGGARTSGLHLHARTLTLGSAASRLPPPRLLAAASPPSPARLLLQAPLSPWVFSRGMVLRGHAPWVKAIKAERAAKKAKVKNWKPQGKNKKTMPKLLGRKVTPHVSRKAVRRALKTGHLMKRGASGLYGGKIIKFGNSVSESGNK